MRGPRHQSESESESTMTSRMLLLLLLLLHPPPHYYCSARFVAVVVVDQIPVVFHCRSDATCAKHSRLTTASVLEGWLSVAGLQRGLASTAHLAHIGRASTSGLRGARREECEEEERGEDLKHEAQINRVEMMTSTPAPTPRRDVVVARRSSLGEVEDIARGQRRHSTPTVRRSLQQVSRVSVRPLLPRASPLADSTEAPPANRQRELHTRQQHSSVMFWNGS